MKRGEKKLNFLRERNEMSELAERGGKNEVSRRTERASFPLLFTEGYDYQAQAIFLSVSVSFPLNPSLWLVPSISAHDLAGAAEAPAQLCNFIHVYFTGIFLSIFSPEHFPSHYSAFPLQRYAVFNLPFVSRFLAWGSEYNNDVRFFFFFFLAHHLLYFNTCHEVHFGNWSGPKEKESSSSHKHLDNCLLQHEKQLEVSGSWKGWRVGVGVQRVLWVSGLYWE